MRMHYTADHGLSLRKRRRWFADESDQDEGQQQKPQPEKDKPEPDGTSAETENTGADREPMIPRERFDDVNTRLKDAQATLAKIEAERETERKKAEKAAADQLAEQGKFKELFEGEQSKVTSLETEKGTLQNQLKTAQEQIEAMTAIFQGQLQARLEHVPEYVKDLLKDKPVLDAISWLDDHHEDIEPQRTGAPRMNAADGLRAPEGKTRALRKQVRL